MPLSLFSQPPVGLKGRNLPGCYFNKDFPEAVSVAVSTLKDTGSSSAAELLLSVLKWSGLLGTNLRSFRFIFVTCSISQSHSWRRLAG